MPENEISRLVVDLCFKLHNQYVPGLFESVYEELFCYKWNKNQIFFSKQKAIPLIREQIKLDTGFRADVVIDNNVLLEFKSVEVLA